MTRATDVQAMQLGGDVSVVDLTPTPLTAAGQVGDWVRLSGRPAFLQVEISNTTTPVAQVVFEVSNDRVARTAKVWFTYDLTGSAPSNGDTTFSGAVWGRLRCVSISGVSAAVTGTLARS